MSEQAKLVIIAYQPKPDKADALRELIANHVPNLAKLGLVTNRAPIIVEAANGIIIEIFEWFNASAIEQAHSNARVNEIWAAFAEVCNYVPLNTLPETAELFAAFTPVN